MKILMVLTSHSTLGNSKVATGYWLDEFAAPYYAFVDADMSVTIASPKGGRPPLDPASAVPAAASEFTERLSHDPMAQAALDTTVRLAQIRADSFDAVFYPGGHGPMFDLAEDPTSIALIEAFANAKKPIVAVCHAPAVLRHVRVRGQFLVHKKRVTGFSNEEEAAVGLTTVVPFLLESELKELGAFYEKVDPWESFVVVDGQLITGQNPASARAAALELVNMLTPVAHSGASS